MSGIRPPDCSKLAKNPKNNNDVTILRYGVIIKIFWHCFVSLVKFSYWSKVHVNIITGSGIMTVFIYKALTRNLEIGNTHVWVFLNIWRLGWVMDIKFGKNVSNRMLQNAAKFQGYRFCHFWVINGTPTGGEAKLPTPPPLLAHLPRLGVYAGNENFCIEIYMDLHTILHHFNSLLIKRVQNWCPRIFRNPYSRQWWESLCWLFLNWWLHTDK